MTCIVFVSAEDFRMVLYLFDIYAGLLT